MAVQPYSLPGSPISFNTYTPDYIGKPIQQIGQTMMSMSHANNMLVDKANNLDIALSNLRINPIDRNILIAQKNKFDNTINNISSSENFNSAQGQLNKLYKDYATNQQLKYAISRNAQYMQQRAEYNRNRNKYDAESYNYIMSRPFTPTVADKHGFYHNFALPQIMQKYDYSKELQRLGDNAPIISRETAPTVLRNINGDIVGYAEHTIKGKNVNAIHKDMLYSAESNPNTVAYANQLAQIRNAEGRLIQDNNGAVRQWTPNDIIQQWVAPLANSYNGTSVTSTSKYDKNPFLTSNYDYLPGTILNNSIYSKINDAIKAENTPSFGASDIYGTAGFTDYMTNKLADSQGNNTNIKYSDNNQKLNHLTDINTNINGLDNISKQTIYNMRTSLSESLYKNSFDNLDVNEKLKIYSSMNTALNKNIGSSDDNSNQLNNISYQRFGVTDKNEQENDLRIFTSNSSGRIKDKDGNVLINSTIKSHRVWDNQTGKFMNGEQFYNILKKANKNTIINVVGKTDYTNSLTSQSDSYGFANGLVIDVNGKDGSKTYVVGDNINNVKNRKSMAFAMLYNSRNSIVNGGSRIYPRGIPAKVDINGKPTQVYMTVDKPRSSMTDIEKQDPQLVRLQDAKILYYVNGKGQLLHQTKYNNNNALTDAIISLSGVYNLKNQ